MREAQRIYSESKNDLCKAIEEFADKQGERLYLTRIELIKLQFDVSGLISRVVQQEREIAEVIEYYKTMKDTDWWCQGYQTGYEQAKKECEKCGRLREEEQE